MALPYPVHTARGERLRCTEGLRPSRPAACSGGRGRALTTHDRYCNFARSSNTMCRERGRAAEASRPRPSSSADSLASTSGRCEIRYLRAPGARASRSPAGPGRVCYAGCALIAAAAGPPAACPPHACAAAADYCRGTRTRGASGARLGCTPVGGQRACSSKVQSYMNSNALPYLPYASEAARRTARTRPCARSSPRPPGTAPRTRAPAARRSAAARSRGP